MSWPLNLVSATTPYGAGRRDVGPLVPGTSLASPTPSSAVVATYRSSLRSFGRRPRIWNMRVAIAKLARERAAELVKLADELEG